LRPFQAWTGHIRARSSVDGHVAVPLHLRANENMFARFTLVKTRRINQSKLVSC